MNEFTREMGQALLAPFPSEEIEWLPQSANREKTQAMALPYIDARAVMRRLDQVVGAGNWAFDFDLLKDDGSMVKGKLTVFGVTKCDAGESDGRGIELSKAAVSDALKRAAVHWGIGRFLYALEQKWVPCKVTTGGNGKEYIKLTETPRLTPQELERACRIIGYDGALPGARQPTPPEAIAQVQREYKGEAQRPAAAARPASASQPTPSPPEAPSAPATARLETVEQEADTVNAHCKDCGGGPLAGGMISASNKAVGRSLCSECLPAAVKAKQAEKIAARPAL